MTTPLPDMPDSPQLSPAAVDQPIAIAILALGGQGGGVLMDWIVSLAEREGWIAQATSVPGVAQRTGATIYYVEAIRPRAGAPYPVLALMPNPGRVDVVICAELMEAGRAMQRGLVTPDRTTLITSTHRVYAIREKTAPGDGAGAASPVLDAAGSTARAVLAFDMAQVAEQSGSVISAVMFGALAASGRLPFARESYETVIREAGVGVGPSLKAFAAGYDQANSGAPLSSPQTVSSAARAEGLRRTGDPGYDALIARAERDFPQACHAMLDAGLRRVVDFQDVAYGGEYLDLVAPFIALSTDDGTLLRNAAKYIANAMAYDDVIRVADLKTRAQRFTRIRDELRAGDDPLLLTEFMHPRGEEVVGLFPAKLGRFVHERAGLMRALDRVVNKGRRVETSKLRWFLPLYVLGGLRFYRRRTLRHANEVAHRDHWLAIARDMAATDPALGAEVLRLRRLVKGYSDTHARGLSKFDLALAGAQKLKGRADAAAWVRRLHDAALADETGEALKGALKTVDTFL
jgi:indolepyruvate ferredoxin oxidoreductase beta subunit